VRQEVTMTGTGTEWFCALKKNAFHILSVYAGCSVVDYTGKIKMSYQITIISLMGCVAFWLPCTWE
jgi:hypothetical protein